MSEFATLSRDRKVKFYLPEETEESSSILGGTAVILLMSLIPIPLTFFLNTQLWMHDPLMILIIGAVVLLVIFLVPYLSLRKLKDTDPILYGLYCLINNFQHTEMKLGQCHFLIVN